MSNHPVLIISFFLYDCIWYKVQVYRDGIKHFTNEDLLDLMVQPTFFRVLLYDFGILK